jgi:hypothetical protein
MPLDAALTSIGVARFAMPDIRAFQRHGEPIALVSRNRAMLEKGFTEYEFPRGIGSLPAETDGSSRVTRCVSAFDRAATRQAARRPRR